MACRGIQNKPEQLRKAHQGEGNFNLASSAPLNYLNSLTLPGRVLSSSRVSFVFLFLCLFKDPINGNETVARKKAPLTDTGYERRFRQWWSDALRSKVNLLKGNERPSPTYKLWDSKKIAYVMKYTLSRRDFHHFRMPNLVFI